MATTRALLLIADIGGYTRFMRLHRMSLVHAQENTARLLEAVIDAVPRLTLNEIEGDAAFLFVPEPEDEELSRSIADVAVAMHKAFHAEQERMTALNLCRCDACSQTGRLSVKIVAHVGEVAAQTIRGLTSLAGVDVILVHRMLKNSVPVPEYVLMTEPLYGRCDPPVRARAVQIDEELEGLGKQRLYFVDIGQIAGELPPHPEPSLPERLRYATALTARSFPALVGLKQPASRPDEID